MTLPPCRIVHTCVLNKSLLSSVVSLHLAKLIFWTNTRSPPWRRSCVRFRSFTSSNHILRLVDTRPFRASSLFGLSPCFVDNLHSINKFADLVNIFILFQKLAHCGRRFQLVKILSVPQILISKLNRIFSNDLRNLTLQDFQGLESIIEVTSIGTHMRNQRVLIIISLFNDSDSLFLRIHLNWCIDLLCYLRCSLRGLPSLFRHKTLHFNYLLRRWYRSSILRLESGSSLLL